MVSTGQWSEAHCSQRTVLAVVQHQKSVPYSSTIIGLKPHRTFVRIITTQNAGTQHNIERYVEKCDNDGMEQYFV